MRAAWWWLDRWRKSTAFTDMTVEEQGAYRNLLDEIWIREDGVIPERSLGKASGDSVAWPRLAKKVLRWMKRVPGGWTNQTAMDVKAETVASQARQSLKGKKSVAKASRRPDGKFQPHSQPHSQPHGQPHSQPHSQPEANQRIQPETNLPSPSPSPSITEEQRTQRAVLPLRRRAENLDDSERLKPDPEEYGRVVWKAFTSTRGSDTPAAKPTEYALIRRWYDQDIPARVVIGVFQECAERIRGARSLMYAGPIVEEALKRWRKNLNP